MRNNSTDQEHHSNIKIDNNWEKIKREGGYMNKDKNNEKNLQELHRFFNKLSDKIIVKICKERKTKCKFIISIRNNDFFIIDGDLLTKKYNPSNKSCDCIFIIENKPDSSQGIKFFILFAELKSGRFRVKDLEQKFIHSQNLLREILIDEIKMDISRIKVRFIVLIRNNFPPSEYRQIQNCRISIMNGRNKQAIKILNCDKKYTLNKII